MSTSRAFDALLVLQYQSGDKNALGILVNRHHKRFCSHAYWYTHDLDIAKDVVQESWGIIIKKLAGLRDPNCFSSWAMKIVTRKSLDILKQYGTRKSHLKYDQLESEYEEEEAQGSEVLKLRDAIKQLPNDQQMVLRLFYTQEYSLREISGILDVSVGTVKSRLFHAREKLKRILKT